MRSNMLAIFVFCVTFSLTLMFSQINTHKALKNKPKRWSKTVSTDIVATLEQPVKEEERLWKELK